MTATERRQQIHYLLKSLTSQKDQVLELVTEAKAQDDHLALGFASWSAYVSAEFAQALTELTRDDRRWVAFALSQTGMSSRAIAPIVGVTDRQVRADVTQVGSDFPPDRADVAAVKNVTPDRSADVVVGMDGKSYTRPSKRQPRRRSLPDAYYDAAYELQKGSSQSRV